ncbi:MAG TPA: hypothetical protein VMJ70_04200 [Candidatus Sulfotelmatobacter sp.]|nr:hypothetical protein [Candidatus Sulfotelmatobacter sp.]
MSIGTGSAPADLVPTARRRSVLPLVLPLLDLLVRLAGAMRPLRYLDGLTIPDDAYLSLTLARNLARGLGPLYGTAPTSGVQPLFAFLMSPAFAIWSHQTLPPVRFALVMLALCDALCLAVLLLWWRRFVRSESALAVAGLAWVLSPYALQTSLNAMDTTLACLAVVISLTLLDRVREASGFPWIRRAAVAGASVALASFARIDSALLVPVGIVAIVVWSRARDGRSRPALAACAAFAIAATLVYAPWLVYQSRLTGELMPVSGRALHYLAMANVAEHPTFANFAAPMTVKAIVALARRNVFPITLLTVLAIALTVRRRWPAAGAGLRRLAPFACFVALLLLAHTYWVATSWYFPRYFFPVLPLLLGAVAVLTQALATSLVPQTRLRLAAALAVLTVVGNVAQPPFLKVFLSRDSRTLGYMNLGRWARDRFVPGTVVGGMQTGALAYFGEGLQVVNLDGVVNTAALRATFHRRILDYARASGVTWVVGWKDDADYLVTHTAGADSSALTLAEPITGFLSWNQPWYLWRLNPRPAAPPR